MISSLFECFGVNDPLAAAEARDCWLKKDVFRPSDTMEASGVTVSVWGCGNVNNAEVCCCGNVGGWVCDKVEVFGCGTRGQENTTAVA